MRCAFFLFTKEIDKTKRGVLRFFREIIKEFGQKRSFEEFSIEFLTRLEEKEVRMEVPSHYCRKREGLGEKGGKVGGILEGIHWGEENFLWVF